METLPFATSHVSTEIHRDFDFLHGIYREVEEKDCYGLEKPEFGVYDVLIDLGLNVGFVSRKALRLNLAKRIEGVECYAPYCDAAARNLEPWNVDGRVKIRMGYAAGRAYESAYQKFSTAMEDKLVLIDDIVTAALKKKETIALKIDIEGWEYPVLKSLMDNNILWRIHKVFGEYHAPREEAPYVVENTHESVHDFLKQLGSASRKKLTIIDDEPTKYILGTFVLQ